MKIAISNIAWKAEDDRIVYEIMKENGFTGLEIAPTRIIPENPYNNLQTIKEWEKQIKQEFNFQIPSMQSIWFGRTEKIFGTQIEFNDLLNYTYKAIEFAEHINCKNLVFGCPRNRVITDNYSDEKAVLFFRSIGDYAYRHNTVIGMEANPTIYNTNYINSTSEALELIDRVDSQGFRLNLDIGTMIYNCEQLDIIKGKVDLINHVHISEPNLKPILERKLHLELYDLLNDEGYDKYISIEMGSGVTQDQIISIMKYIVKIFT